MLLTTELTAEHQNFLKEWEKNPADYSLVRIEVYDDPMNEANRIGYYQYVGEGFFLVPKEHAQDVAMVSFDFTHTNIRFFKEDGQTVLFSTIGEGYEDIEGAKEDITAFHVGEYEGANLVNVLVGTSMSDESFSLFHPVKSEQSHYDEQLQTRIVTYDSETESWMNRTDIEHTFYRFRKDELLQAERLLTAIVEAKTIKDSKQAIVSFKALAK